MLLAAAFLSGVLWLWCTLASLGGHRPLLPIIAHTEFGRVWCFRLALNLLLIAAITLMPAAGSRLRQTLLCLFSAALLVSLAWLGHSATSQGVTGAERLITMAIHLLCAGGWLGGLVMLTLRLRELRAAGQAPSADFAATLSRFSSMGYFAVTLIFVTGLVNLRFTTTSFVPDTSTLYGQLAVAKLALFLSAVTFALINRIAVAPHLQESQQPTRTLMRNIWAEQLLLLAAVCVVAVLGETAPMAMP